MEVGSYYFPVIGGIVVEAGITFPGGCGEGISPGLYNAGISEVNISGNKQLIGFCPGYGTPLEYRLYRYSAGTSLGAFQPEGSVFSIQAGSE